MTTITDAFAHHSIRDISRANGGSAIKTAAYIGGVALFDDRRGETFGRDTGKGRVLAFEVVGPQGTAWDAGALWSAAEKAERRGNARTAQERTLALPEELDEATQRRLLRGYALWHRDEYGVAASWALHEADPRGDSRNRHGHIMTTTRAVIVGADGTPLFGEKVRRLSGNREVVAAEVERQRQEWARRVNAELEKAGSARRLDHRSHERRAETGDGPQGMERGQHLGPKVCAQTRRKQGEARTGAEAGRVARNAARKAVWEIGQKAARSAALPGPTAPADRSGPGSAAGQAAALTNQGFALTGILMATADKITDEAKERDCDQATRVARAAAWSAQKMKKAARDAYWDDAAEAAGHDDDEGR
jgi:hypothetical protein